MTTDTPIPADPTTRREAVVWVLAAVTRADAIAYWCGNRAAGACGKIHRRRVVVGRWLAALTLLFAGWHARGIVTAGPSRVEAKGEAVAADPRLQRGYADPAAGEDDRAAVDDPMAPLVPDAPMSEYAAPGGPDDGTAPTWLPEGLAPWWLDIVAAAHENGLDSHAWAAIVAQENPWGNPAATSQAGAQGLAQLMPMTAADIAGQTGIDVTTPTGNLRGGAWYFAERVRDNGDLWTAGNDLPTLLAAAAAYNGGGPPSQDVRAAAMAGASDLCAGVRYAETRTYCYAYADRWAQTQAERAGATLEAMTR